jgi:hypothetical protein
VIEFFFSRFLRREHEKALSSLLKFICVKTMKIKSAKSFRFWYKTKVKEIDRNSPIYNENFIGTYHIEGGKKIKGFFEMYHSDKPDTEKCVYRKEN